MGVASLVLGIVGLVFSLFGGGIVGAILGIVGIILGALGRKNPNTKGVATAGLVLSILATIFGLIFYVACAACVTGIGSSLY